MNLPLEDFSEGIKPPQEADTGPDPAETARVEGYEAGYKSGWDDAVKSQSDDRQAVGAELANNLRDLSFTYFEARDEIISALSPFLEQLIDTLFPALLAESTASSVCAELTSEVHLACDGGARLYLSPDDIEVVRSLLNDARVENVTVIEEELLLSGQARLCAAAREVHFDADRLVKRLRASLSAEGDPYDDFQDYREDPTAEVQANG
ncbi:MAG: hypothetical protein AAGA87_09755 [Pseudomonadota bacterium]